MPERAKASQKYIFDFYKSLILSHSLPILSGYVRPNLICMIMLAFLVVVKAQEVRKVSNENSVFKCTTSVETARNLS